MTFYVWNMYIHGKWKRNGEWESGNTKKIDVQCIYKPSPENGWGGKRHTSISNGIAFRWKIHFKLKINVLQKHILSFGIDNINSSCVRFYISYEIYFVFCAHRIPAHKLRSHCDKRAVYEVENTKYYFLYEKSIYENPWQIFGCFLALAILLSFPLILPFSPALHSLCGALSSPLHTLMHVLCMHACRRWNEWTRRRCLVMFHVAVSNS